LGGLSAFGAGERSARPTAVGMAGVSTALAEGARAEVAGGPGSAPLAGGAGAAAVAGAGTSTGAGLGWATGGTDGDFESPIVGD
jgi:hypothetical protein